MLLDKAKLAKIIPNWIPVAFMLLAYRGKIGLIIPSPVIVMSVAKNRVMYIFLFISAINALQSAGRQSSWPAKFQECFHPFLDLPLFEVVLPSSIHDSLEDL